MAAHHIIDGMSTAQALRTAGITPKANTARAAAMEIAQQALRRAGATPERVARSHVALLDAVTTETIKRPGEDGSLQVVEERAQVDNASRRWAIEHAYKIHGAYPREQETPTHPSGPIVAIEFVTQAPHTEDAGSRVTAAIAFNPLKREAE